MKLLHVLNPRAFLIPEFQDFLLRAFATDPFVWALEALVGLSKSVATNNPHIALFVTTDENGQYVGMAIAANSLSALAPGCSVLHFYNKNSNHESRNLLIKAIIEFAKAHGNTKIRGVDTNNKPRAFVKLFETAIGPATAKGQVYEFKIEETE